jgi:antitoxin Phd
MTIISVSAARERLPEAIEAARVDAVFLERYGRTVAVLVSPERYDQLVEALDDAEDVDLFDEAMAEGGPTIPWEQVKADLGWA